MVEESVDDDLDLVGVRLDVAPAQQFLDAVRVGIEGADECVEIVVIVRDPELRLEGGRQIFARVELAKSAGGYDGGPDRIVLAAIDDGRSRGAHGRCRRYRPRR